jgi:magnesium transporter
MLTILLTEHDSDMARLGGYLAGASRARGAAQEPSARRSSSWTSLNRAERVTI